MVRGAIRRRVQSPEGWRQRIINADSQCPEGLWYFFATRFSKAYYYPASTYTAEEALQATIAQTGIPSRVYTMDDFLYRLARAGAPACISAEWRDAITPSFKLYDVPVIGARVTYYEDKPVRVGLIFAGFGGTTYSSGTTYRETIVNPQQHTLQSPINGE
ncbi:hypothetical protein [Hyperthermus butylicus]|nr:hypothetical protein [Hyperthermus butylicus]